MTSIEEFVTAAAVTAGSGVRPDRGKLVASLESYLSMFKTADQRSAMLSAQGGLRDINLSGSICDFITTEIEARLTRFRTLPEMGV